MNSLYVILSVLVTYISISAAESNSTAALSAERIASYCYYCANCPRPFTPNSPAVTQVNSPTGWCVRMSNSDAFDPPASRGAAQPGLCSFNGCQWRIVGGVNTYVCCCSNNLCNGANPVPTTTARPYTTTCFYCANCPRPFTRYSSAVTEVYSPTGWCAKMGSSSSITGIYTRGAAVPGLCSWNGCTWQIVGGVNTYVCCCNRYLCNTGVSTSQSIVAVLSTAFITTIVTFKSF